MGQLEIYDSQIKYDIVIRFQLLILSCLKQGILKATDEHWQINITNTDYEDTATSGANEKKLEEYIDKENDRRDEFISSVKSTLVKMNNENMDLYQNLSKSMKGNIESVKMELVNNISNGNSDIKEQVHLVNNSVNQLKNDITLEITKLREVIEIKNKSIKTLLFAILGVVSCVVVLIIIALFL